jgi:hypothetical protein
MISSDIYSLLSSLAPPTVYLLGLYLVWKAWRSEAAECKKNIEEMEGRYHDLLKEVVRQQTLLIEKINAYLREHP